jgi:hypothetical protein|tara:strand:+ start:2616 stop:2921 length:306 start_codon:yes stop_codon:yes gene_type:complete
MNIAMFIVGASIFSVYVVLLVWNIFYSNKKQREENYPGYYARHGQPEQDNLEVRKQPKQDNLEVQLMNAKINSTSPYNDGWTQEGYKEQVTHLEKKIKSVK